MSQQYKAKVELNSSPIEALLKEEGYGQPHIKILVRNAKLLLNQTIELNPKETFAQLKQYLCETTPLYLFENYHFQVNGKQQPQSSQIGVSFGADSEDAVLEIVMDLFDQRTSKHHVKMVQEIIANPVLWAVVTYRDKDEKDRAFGRDYLSPSALQECSKQQKTSSSLCSGLGLAQVLTPSFDSPFLSHQKQHHFKQIIQFLNFSGYNPPPTNRKLQGDFFYLHIKTLEGLDIHITSNSRGYFINKSTVTQFDPYPHEEYTKTYLSLLDLLQALSPKFKEGLKHNVQQLVLSEAERLAITSHYRCQNIWIGEKPKNQHKWNANRSEDRATVVENSEIKDWNELLQAQHALPTGTVIERLNKTKLMIKVYNQFAATAIQGAKALVEGRMSPLNPLDDRLQHIYIHNSIFYSIAKQTPYDYSQDKGLDATPTVSAINTDLRNLSILLNLQINDLHVLHMVLVEYRGFKIMAQCIIPGILTSQQLHCSQYGSIDDGKTIYNNKQFEALMVQVCQKMGIDSNVEFTDSSGNVKKIAGSIEVKGILGSDKRKYILDLLRLSPRDYNFLGPKYHSCVLRPELLSLYKSNCKQAAEYADLPLNVNLETSIEFIHTSSTKRQEQNLISIANYAKNHCVPQLIKALATTERRSLSDTKGVVKAMHSFGLNSRYLGEILKQTSKEEFPHVRMVLQRIVVVKSLKHLFRMALRNSSPLHLSTVLCRLLNCVFGTSQHRKLLEEGVGCPSSATTLNMESTGDQSKKKGKKKKYKSKDAKQPAQDQFMIEQFLNLEAKSSFDDITIVSSKYADMKPSEVWEEVCQIARCRYFYQLPKQYWLESDLKQAGFNKIATLRDLCLQIGLVLERKQYSIFQGSESGTELPFQSPNILQLQARAKHIQFSNKQASYLIQRADTYLSRFQVDEAIQLYNSSVQYMVGLYGGMHEQIAIVHHKIANVYFRFGHYMEAVMCQRSSLDLLRQMHGEDSLLTIESYSNLALFYFNQLDKDLAIYYLLKSIYLAHFAFGAAYPQIIVNMFHLSAVYQQCSEHQLAIKCLMEALERTVKIYGQRHLNTAVCYHALASLHFEISDLRQAIDFQEIATKIYRQVLRENDSRVVENVSILNKYKEMQTTRKLMIISPTGGATTAGGAMGDMEMKKMPISRDQKAMMMGAPGSTARGNVQNGGYQRNSLLKRLQMAKLNSRMGFKR